jgi:3-dehydroquinate dehydratase-2
MRIAVLHGPNLNRLGIRRPDKYGTTTLADITKHLDEAAARLGVEAMHFQSNAEYALIDWIHEHQHEFEGIVINPAGLTAAGYSLLDAVRDPGYPFAVVHISQYHAIDGKERDDIFASTAAVYITGAGWRGYSYALEAIFHKIDEATPAG